MSDGLYTWESVSIGCLIQRRLRKMLGMGVRETRRRTNVNVGRASFHWVISGGSFAAS